MALHVYKTDKSFQLEQGGLLKELEITYHTWGQLNERADNAVWICHALTADSNAAEWWYGMIGEGLLFDTKKYFTVCVNILGSCYGTTGPLSINPDTGHPYFRSFPEITFRDQVKMFEIIRKHLGIQSIHTIMGGSIGGAQAMEYSIMFPDLIQHLVVVASGTSYAPWAIAFDQSQRLAIEADATFFEDRPDGGWNGMKAARSTALLSYRNDRIYNKTQKELSDEVLHDFRAVSYQNYQGEKLAKRFNAYSYHTLLKLSDTHNVGRGRGGKEKALEQITARVLSIGISSDLLFPVYEMKYLAGQVVKGTYREIDSLYGHDGFLIETEKITKLVQNFYKCSNKHE